MDDRSIARTKVWNALRSVALPDSRFHYDFSEFITDFQESDQAITHLTKMDIYKNSQAIFITPDNCLERLRSQTIRNRKTMLMTTYGIRRGFVELQADDVQSGLEDYAVLLDAIEKVGRHISLAEIQERYKIDLLVTGGSAVTRTGGRLGKGHGYFDIEWATLYSIGVVETSTPIVDIVHDCQLVDDELKLTPYDTTCDYIITPTQVIHVPSPQKPTGGVYWNQLAPGMMENISVLAELQDLKRQGKLRTSLSQ
jgi:5-formyltetrahydrofolate cyclo-ligase